MNREKKKVSPFFVNYDLTPIGGYNVVDKFVVDDEIFYKYRTTFHNGGAYKIANSDFMFRNISDYRKNKDRLLQYKDRYEKVNQNRYQALILDKNNRIFEIRQCRISYSYVTKKSNIKLDIVNSWKPFRSGELRYRTKLEALVALLPHLDIGDLLRMNVEQIEVDEYFLDSCYSQLIKEGYL